MGGGDGAGHHRTTIESESACIAGQNPHLGHGSGMGQSRAGSDSSKKDLRV